MTSRGPIGIFVSTNVTKVTKSPEGLKEGPPGQRQGHPSRGEILAATGRRGGPLRPTWVSNNTAFPSTGLPSKVDDSLNVLAAPGRLALWLRRCD